MFPSNEREKGSFLCKFCRNAQKLLAAINSLRSLSYRNQTIDLLCKLMDWFLYDRDLCHEIVFWRSQNLPLYKSDSNFLSIDLLKLGFQDSKIFEANINLYPEVFCKKNVNYYIFEQREEKYYKNWEEKVYYRTARADDEREMWI